MVNNMSKDRLRSTGRKPSLDVAGVEALLERYCDGSNVSIATLAEEKGLTEATVRKYLKAAGLDLPRGRAALKPRPEVSVRALMNRMPTEILIGTGRAELLRRRLEAGDSMTSLAADFGISRDRVRRYRDELGLAPEKPAKAEAVAPEAAAAPEPEAVSEVPVETVEA